MKKILITLLMALTLAPAMDARKANATAIRTVVREFSGREGFETVSLGGLGLSMIKVAAYHSADEEDKEALKVANGIKRLLILEYEDASAEDRARFEKKLGKVLDGAEKFMEVKDDGETVSIYGTLSKDGTKISDVVLYVPDSCALICLFGSVRTEDLDTILDETERI